ncbi:MAG: hypothetical protein NT107_14580 [Planctomycetota bacterium]|nr:hypothetical protein [Planctomycetota bacterium]
MCLTRKRQLDLERWNWEGDLIVHDSVVPTSRPLPGHKAKDYPTDIRKFLITTRSDVLSRAVQQDLRQHVQSLPGGDWNRFTGRTAGCFDYRARIVSDFLAQQIAYRFRGNEAWLFPEETLLLRAGDCEDRALLTAALLLQCGISSFNLRVAIGKVRLGSRQAFDHAWVAYKTEIGTWTVIDPPAAVVQQAPRGRKRAPAERLPRYEPYFLFNDHHVWRVWNREAPARLSDYVAREWQKADPNHLGAVHLDVVQRALTGADQASVTLLEERFQRPLRGLFTPLIDAVDRLDYDPALHFDNGYVDAGWAIVNQKLAEFRADPSQAESFTIAAHGIADFYAHSSYVHFAAKESRMQGDEGPSVACYLSGVLNGGLKTAPSYQSGSGFDLLSRRFTCNDSVLEVDRQTGAAHWEGKILTGRYAQHGDGHGEHLDHLIEASTWIPEHYLQDHEFHFRGALPHHREIAIDDHDRDAMHELYTTDKQYREQFDLRTNTAILHVRQAFEQCLRG